MSRVLAVAGMAVGFAAFGAQAAGTAAAFEFEADPGRGVYGMIHLDERETAAFAGTPLPRMLDQLWSDEGLYAPDPTSYLPGADPASPVFYAEFSDVVEEAAARGGVVSIGVIDVVVTDNGDPLPGAAGRPLVIHQFL